MPEKIICPAKLEAIIKSKLIKNMSFDILYSFLSLNDLTISEM